MSTMDGLPLEIVAHLKEMQSRAEGDPLRTWKPHAKQRAFIDSVMKGEARTNLALFGNRTGKTDAGAWIDAAVARFGNPLARPDGYGKVQVTDRAASIWVVSPDFPSSRDIIQPKIFDNGFVSPGQTHLPFIPAREIREWRTGDQLLRLHNGSIIGFKSADSPRTKFQGTGKDLVHFDEEPPLGHFEEATLRVEAGRALSVIFTCTILPPEGQAGGISWMFDKFVKPWKRREPNLPYRIFSAGIYDNPHIGLEEIRHLEAMYPPGSIQRRIRLDGELIEGMGGSRVYGNFSFDVHMKEQGPLDPRRPLVWFWDFNVNPMITGIGQRDGRLFRVHDELVIRDGASIDDMCDLFYETYGDWKGQIWIYGDQTGEGRSVQTSSTNYTLIMNRMRFHHLFPKLRLPVKNPFVKDRINAMNLQLLDEGGASWIEIDPKCTELIADLAEVLYDNRGLIKKSNKVEDPYYQRTHASDAFGYWICYEEPVRELSMKERIRRTIRDPGYSSGRR